jgi:hypothetical protein
VEIGQVGMRRDEGLGLNIEYLSTSVTAGQCFFVVFLVYEAEFQVDSNGDLNAEDAEATEKSYIAGSLIVWAMAKIEGACIKD